MNQVREESEETEDSADSNEELGQAALEAFQEAHREQNQSTRRETEKAGTVFFRENVCCSLSFELSCRFFIFAREGGNCQGKVGSSVGAAAQE